MSSTTRRLLFGGAACVLVIEAVSLAIRLGSASAPYDDAFITFRYARNFAEGLGLVYNPGETRLGTTTPAYALLLGLLHWLWPARDIVWLATWLSAFALAATAWLALKLVAEDFGPIAGVAAMLSVAVNPVLLGTWGGEWLIALPLVAGAFVAYRADRLGVAAALAAVAIILRSEAALAGAVLIGDALVRRKPGAVRAVAVMAALGAAWALVLWGLTGQVFPDSFGAKLAHARSHIFKSVPWGLAFIGRQLFLADYRIAAVVLLGWHGALLAVARGGIWRLMAGWIAAHFVFYAWLRMPFYTWYLVPVVFGLSLAAGIGCEAVAIYVRSIVTRRRLAGAVSGALIALLVVLMVASEARSSRDWIRAKPDPRERLYNELGAWLAANTPADASVAYLEIGRVGYFSRRRIVDLMGLVTPDVADRVANQDLLWAVYRYRPDYYVTSSIFSWAGSAAKEDWFPGAYDLVREYRAPEEDTTIRIYRKRPDAVFPAAPVIEAVQLGSSAPVGEIVPPVAHGQTFVASRDGLFQVATILATYGRANRGRGLARVEQLDPPRVVLEEPFDLEGVADNQWRFFTFEPVADSAGRAYRLTITALDAAPGRAITIWYHERDRYPGGHRLVNGSPAPGDLTLKLAYRPPP